MTDFRDHHIKKALDEAVGAYLPETTRRSRIRRIAIVAALALAAFAAFWTVLYHSTPKPGKPAADRRPVPVQILPAPAKR